MKALKAISLIAVIGVLFTLSNCGGGGTTPEPVADVQLAKLSKTWKLTAVTREGQDQSSLYATTGTPFQLIITGTKGAASFGYTTKGNPPSASVWKGSGSWVFGTQPETMITRDPTGGNPPGTDKLEMSYTVTATTLEITFSFSGTGYPSQGRSEAVTGAWKFTFGQ